MYHIDIHFSSLFDYKRYFIYYICLWTWQQCKRVKVEGQFVICPLTGKYYHGNILINFVYIPKFMLNEKCLYPVCMANYFSLKSIYVSRKRIYCPMSIHDLSFLDFTKWFIDKVCNICYLKIRNGKNTDGICTISHTFRSINL